MSLPLCSMLPPILQLPPPIPLLFCFKHYPVALTPWVLIVIYKSGSSIVYQSTPSQLTDILPSSSSSSLLRSLTLKSAGTLSCCPWCQKYFMQKSNDSFILGYLIRKVWCDYTQSLILLIKSPSMNSSHYNAGKSKMSIARSLNKLSDNMYSKNLLKTCYFLYYAQFTVILMGSESHTLVQPIMWGILYPCGWKFIS